MTSSPMTAYALDSIQLLVTAAATIHGASKILKTEEKDGELRVFYTDVTAYCAMIAYHWKRISKVVYEYGVDEGLVFGTLDHLESAIASDILHLPHDTLPSSPRYRRLRAFNRHWHSIQKQSDKDVRLQLIRSCTNFGANVEERNRFAQSLAGYEEELQARYPENQSDWILEELSANASLRQPSFAVWNAAQSIFKALVACSNCECTPTHNIRAQLRLGTYRKPNVGGGIDADTDLDFDMFLSMKQDWQEAHVLMVKENVVQFQINNAMEQPKGKNRATKITQMRVKQLCEPIAKIQAMAAHRLEFKVIRDQLFKIRSERSTFLIDRTRSPITLEEFLRNGSRPFTERTRRILAVMLSYAVLYLHDTPWLQPTWSSSHVLFFHADSSAVPLRPFIQTHLEGYYQPWQDPCDDPEDIDPEDVDPDSLDPDEFYVHNCPLLVTLAVMLMELYFAVPFDILAKQYGVGLEGGAQSPILTWRHLYVNQVFEACRSEIPEKFHYAVDKCLHPATWEDEDGIKLGSEALISRIYQEVVKPLETELGQAYSSISIDDLDQFAQGLDVANWDRNIQMWNPRAETEASEDHTQNLKHTHRRQDARYTSQSYSPQSPGGDIYSQHLEEYQYGRRPNVTPGSSCDTPRKMMKDDGYKASRFFDDELVSKVQTDEELSSYQLWKYRYQKVYEKFIPATLVPPSIKIAILDTGIDMLHPDIDARVENIKDKYNWLSKDGKTNVRMVTDRSGHGTFAASLILDYAQDAQLYVAKIADNEPSNARVIAKAINYAVSTWEVDIISMSFGFPTRDIDDYRELESALRNAHANRVLLFAAASNSGGKLGHAYPARDENVIAIHATDTNGNRSGFNPTTRVHEINLATVGEDVESAWPVHLSDESMAPNFLKCKSGTSFATPIAVGIAAFLLLYANIHLPDIADALKSRQRMQFLLERVAKKEAGQSARDGYYFIDLSLYADSLFGKNKSFIDETIQDILKT
ncbi:pfs domain-containing protein [Trichoderma barbatum]